MPNAEFLIQLALEEAHKAFSENEVPVGAVIWHKDQIIASNHNRREQHQNPLSHAEILVIEEAAKQLGSWRLEDCTLAVTLEPCPMCAGAILQSRIPNVLFGAFDPKAGAAGSMLNILVDARFNHRCNITSGILADSCGSILSLFFQQQRKLGKK